MIDHLVESASVFEDAGVDEGGGDDVGVSVGARPSVLEVAFAFSEGQGRHSDGRTAIRGAAVENAPVLRLVVATKSLLDSFPVQI